MDEWLEIHTRLVRHPKFLGFRRELNVGIAEGLGLLVCLWGWAAEVAPNGDLSAFKSEDIAEAAQWTRKPDVLLAALKKHYPPNQTGWLDENMHLHDWMDYTGRLYEIKEAKRLGDKQRQAKRRERIALMSSVSPANVTRDVACDSQTVTRESLPYQTRPDQTRPDHKVTGVSGMIVAPPDPENPPGPPPPPDCRTEIPSREEAIAMTSGAGVAQDFAGYVYDDWAGRGGRDASSCLRPWLQYIKTRWERERKEWMDGTHKGRRNSKPINPLDRGMAPAKTDYGRIVREKIARGDAARKARAENPPPPPPPKPPPAEKTVDPAIVKKLVDDLRSAVKRV